VLAHPGVARDRALERRVVPATAHLAQQVQVELPHATGGWLNA